MRFNMQNFNIGGYDDNAFKDRKAVNIVTDKLLQSNCIMPYLDSGNTVPNIDGYIEICEKADNRQIPVVTFVVQVKSLPENYLNVNKNLCRGYSYKYYCDTKAFNVGFFKINLNPVLLIMVDIETRSIFWKYLSNQYCNEVAISQKRATIYFNDEDRILDVKEWSIKLKRIYDDKLSKTIQIDDPVPEEFQEAFDRLNNILDNELVFLKRILFPTTWKFGISYFVDSESNFKSLGIYRVLKEKNNAFIKNFDTARNINFVEMQYYGRTATDIIDSEILEWINLFFREENFFLCIMPNIVIQDIIFHTLDLHFSKKVMQNSAKNGDNVTLDYPYDEISLQTLESMLSCEQFEKRDFDLLSNCIKELNRRGNTSQFSRFWRRVSKYRVIRKNSNSLSFSPDEDLLSIAKYNIEKFLKNFSNFYAETIIALGDKTKYLFETDEYDLYIGDNLKACSYVKKPCSMLKINWSFESKSIRDFKGIYEQPHVEQLQTGEIALHFQSYVNSYWYDIWQTWCYHNFCNFIKSTDDNFISFIETLRCYRNYYGTSNQCIIL